MTTSSADLTPAIFIVSVLLAMICAWILMRILTARRAYQLVSRPDLRRGDNKYEMLIAAAAVADATLAGIPLVEASSTMNEHVFDALHRWVVHSNAPWSLMDYVKDHHATVFAPDNGFLDGLKGYVAESLVAEHFAHLGHHVALAASTNQPGWDILIDGHEFQIKAGAHAAEAAHTALQLHPDIGIITDPQAAAHLALTDPHATVIGVHEIAAVHLAENTAHTLQNIDTVSNIGAHVPYLTIAFSAFKEINLLIEGHTDFGVALQHVAIDAVGVGAGLTVGAQVGAALGAVGGPIGAGIGGALGGIIGGITGKLASTFLKEARLGRLIDKYKQEVRLAQSKFAAARVEAQREFRLQLETWDREVQAERRRYHKMSLAETRAITRAKQYSRFKIKMSARVLALFQPHLRAQIQVAINTMSSNLPAGIEQLAAIVDSSAENDSPAMNRLRRQLNELIAIYGTATVLINKQERQYLTIIERCDSETRIEAAEMSNKLSQLARTLFYRANELKNEVSAECRRLGKRVPIDKPLQLGS